MLVTEQTKIKSYERQACKQRQGTDPHASAARPSKCRECERERRRKAGNEKQQTPNASRSDGTEV